MNNLKDKVAIVTGASKSIGAGIARRLAADGAQVVVNEARAAAPIGAAIDRFGRLDIVVNNAGRVSGETILASGGMR